jgi:hypothetical protein
MVIKNDSAWPLEFELDYPRWLCAEFHCPDPGALPVGGRRGAQLASSVYPVRAIPPQGAYGVVFALNRYLRFREAKRYTIRYRVWYRTEQRTADGRSRPYQHVDGDFTIAIGPRPVGHADVAALHEQLVRALEEMDPERVHQQIELLCWTDHPTVIPSLELAAARFHPAGREIVTALGRFAQTERGRAALLTVAGSVSGDVLQDVFGACAAHQIPIPHELYRGLLSSREFRKRHGTLRHLLEHGEPGHLPFVLPLTHDKNPEVGAMAERVVAKLQGRQPARAGGPHSGRGEKRTKKGPARRLIELVNTPCRTEAEVALLTGKYLRLLEDDMPAGLRGEVYGKLGEMHYNAMRFGQAYAETAADYFDKALKHPVDVLDACLLYLMWSKALGEPYLHCDRDAFAQARRRAIVPCLLGLKLVQDNLVRSDATSLAPGQDRQRESVPERAPAGPWAPQNRRELPSFQRTLSFHRESLCQWAALLHSYRPHALGELESLLRETLNDRAFADETLGRVVAEAARYGAALDEQLKHGLDPRPEPLLPTRARTEGSPAALAGEAQARPQGSPNEITPRLDDNTLQPLYRDDVEVTLSKLAELAIQKMGGPGLDLGEYLAVHADCKAAVRLIVVRDIEDRIHTAPFHILTVLVRPHDVTIHHIGYDPEAMKRGDLRERLDHARKGEADALEGILRVSEGTFGQEERDRIASELNGTMVFSLRSCEPAGAAWWSIDIGSRPNHCLMRNRAPRASGSFDVFSAIRASTGKVEENSFRVYRATRLADIRYEQLCYVFHRCEPFVDYLRRLREPVWKAARMIPQGDDSFLLVEPTPTETKEASPEPQAAPADAGPSRSWLFIVVGALGVCVGFALGCLFALWRHAPRPADPGPDDGGGPTGQADGEAEHS